MNTVTLISDFGGKDHYVAAVKGALLSTVNELRIVDITHQVPAFDIIRAAHLLRNSYPYFPKGTLHIASVNPFTEQPQQYIALCMEDHFFIAPNNGLLSILFDPPEKEVYELEIAETGSFILPGLLAKASAHLFSGKPLHEIGLPVRHFEKRFQLQPVISHNQIRGIVLHIDHYGNAVTNISRDLFEEVRNGRKFEVYFKRHEPITHIVSNYSEMEVGYPLCLFNSAGLLEIALNCDHAASMLGLKPDDSVQVEFF